MSTRKPPAAPKAVDLEGEAVHWDFRNAMSYGDYLGLKALLGCQKPLSGAHDETLFIVIHQASELWIKLCLHEIAAAIGQIRKDDLGPAFKMMAGPRSSLRIWPIAAAISCRQSLIHNSLAWWMTMNRVSSCAPDSGFWQPSSAFNPR